MAHTIQLTRRGDYLLRDSLLREVGRYQSHALAEATQRQREQEDAARRDSHATQHAASKQFAAQHPNLMARMSAFVDWRNRLYVALCDAGRYLDHERRHAAKRIAVNARYTEIEQQYVSDADRRMTETDAAYQSALTLHRSIYDAFDRRDPLALEAALVQAEAAMAAA